MRCSKARERLQEYIEGMLKGSDLRTFEEHLQSCQDCRRELESLRELDTRLRQEVPQYWESIEPAPGFLARLKRLELEAPVRETPNLAETLSALWGRHRMVLATGLSICIVIALALTIPRMISPVEKAPIIAEKPPQYAPEREVIKEMPSEKVVEREVVKEVPVEKVTAEPAESEVMSARAMAPREAPAPSLKRVPEAALPAQPPAIADYTTEQGELAIEIALSDSAVQEALKDKKYRVIEVHRFTWEEDFICTGPTVTIALGEAESQETLLYACVDLDKRQVVKVMLFPERGSGTLPSP